MDKAVTAAIKALVAAAMGKTDLEISSILWEVQYRMCGISSDAEALQRDPRGRAGGERRADPLTREPAMEVVREQLERNDAKRRLADWWNRRRARDKTSAKAR